jgi:cytosine/adenosine deaminase-related metal-dependent hydrolase
VTIYAGTIADTPGDPFAGDPADALAEAGAVCVRDGVICARGTLAALRAKHPGEPVIQLPGGMLVPGFIDTHARRARQQRHPASQSGGRRSGRASVLSQAADTASPGMTAAVILAGQQPTPCLEPHNV